MKLLLLVVAVFVFMPVFATVSATTGFGPAEIYASNQLDMVIGNATLVNGDDVPKYGVFEMIMPYSDKETFQVVVSEIVHARVLCRDCGHSMQRMEAIPGYKYGDPLIGTCPVCGSKNLIFYDVMPRDEYESLSVKGAGNFHLKKIDEHTWQTEELISPMGACSVNVIYDSSNSYTEEYMGKNWEVHLRGKTVAETGEGFMAGGLDLRVLITFKFPLHLDILDTPVKGESFRAQVKYGPPDKSWLKTPDNPVTIDFNGVKQLTDTNGIATFTFPDTRLDYDYMLTAIGTDTYLSATNVISTGMDGNGGFLDILSNNIYLVILVLAIVVICVGFIIYRYYWE